MEVVFWSSELRTVIQKRSLRREFVGQQESADAYSRGPYAEVTKILANVVSGTPRVDTYEVSNSTFHKIGAAAKS
jgi:hypothetical protein